MKTPILFLIFNRPDTTRKVFASIRKARPVELYIAADGPRVGRPGEKELCEEVRRITEDVNWRCVVKRLYRSKNLGAGKASADAISWFFVHVKEGIILEDDCLPDKSFFEFCTKMLGEYRNDKTIMAISGDNFLNWQTWNKNGYYISKNFCPPWGHATWSRAWKNYDGLLKDWPEIKRDGKIDKVFTSFWEKLYWHVHFNSIYKKHHDDIWDYQWQYAIWKNGGKCIVPGVNLVQNIGLKGGGTHFVLNVNGLSIPAVKINSNPKLLKENFSKKAEDYLTKKLYKTSPFMVLSQWLYYNILK
jgi:hypothetical protein